MKSSPRKPRRTRDPEAKREQILEAAERLFCERGYDKTSTAAIARAAGVSEGTVFHHFGSKSALFADVARGFGEALNHEMFAGMGPDAPPDVPGMIGRCFAYGECKGRLSETIMQTRDPAVSSAAMRAQRQAIVDALTVRFVAWHDKGLIRTERPQVAAAIMFGLVEYALHDGLQGADPDAAPDPERRDAYLAETIRVIEAALRPPEA